MEEKYDMESFKDKIREENIVQTIAVFELGGLIRYTVTVNEGKNLGVAFSDYLEHHVPRYRETPQFPWTTKEFFSSRNIKCDVKVETLNFMKHPITNIKLKLCYMVLEFVHSRFGYDVTKHF